MRARDNAWIVFCPTTVEPSLGNVIRTRINLSVNLKLYENK